MTYHVVRYSDDYSSFCVLKSFDNEDAADNYCCDASHLYAHAHIDYMDDDELATYAE